MSIENDNVVAKWGTKAEDLEGIFGSEGIHANLLIPALEDLDIVTQLRNEGVEMLDQTDGDKYTSDLEKIADFHQAVFNGKTVVQPSSFSYLSPGLPRDTVTIELGKKPPLKGSTPKKKPNGLPKI